MYHADVAPYSNQAVYSAKGLRDRKIQRALRQFFKPENCFSVREALLQAGRQHLIGNSCDCLIPAQPPKEAIEARRRRANDLDHYPAAANPAKGEETGEWGLPKKGYRPGRKSAKLRHDRKRNQKGRGSAPQHQCSSKLPLAGWSSA